MSKLAGCCTGYPEAYFARLPLPTDAVMAVVSACRTDDIYNQARFTQPSCSATQYMKMLPSLLLVTVAKPVHVSTKRDQNLMYGIWDMAVICHAAIA